jgi:transposase-like protein
MKMNRIIVEAVLAGKSQSHVVKQHGISQPRVSQLMAQWRHGGWSALEHQSRRPHGNLRTTPTAITTRILELREELAKSGCDNGAQSIAHALATENLHVPANSTIWRIREKVGKNGNVTIHRAGRCHDIGLGMQHAGTKKGTPRQGGTSKGYKFKPKKI